MDAVTYPEKAVIEFVEKNVIPLRIPFNEEPFASDFRIKWTPTLVTLDNEGEEHHRTVGFFDPGQLIPSLMLGIAKVAFDGDQFEAALEYLEKLIADYPKSDSAPEAIYLHRPLVVLHPYQFLRPGAFGLRKRGTSVNK